MNRGRGAGGGGGGWKSEVIRIKKDKPGRWLTGRIQCAKTHQTNLSTDTPSPQTNQGERGEGRLHTD